MAAHFYRIALILNPNYSRSSSRLSRLVELEADPVLAPLKYAAPAEGLRVRYIQALLPKETRDELEEAIDDLFAWFKPSQEAMPKSVAFVIRSVDEVDGNEFAVSIDLEAVNKRDVMVPKGMTFPVKSTNFRGLFPLG